MPGGLQGARVVETFTSEWDCSTLQFRAVKMGTADDKVVVSSLANEPGVIGVMMNKPTSGEAARVCLWGYSKAQVGTASSRGMNLVVGGGYGFLVPQTAASSGNVVAMAMQQVGSGSVCSVIVNPHFRTLPT